MHRKKNQESTKKELLGNIKYRYYPISKRNNTLGYTSL